MKVEQLPIKTIKVKDRARSELGDLSELVSSIKDKGLIQPITVDAKYNLLAGGRRLQACKDLGHKVISAIVRKVGDEIDRLEIELFENIHRLDFTWVDREKLEKKIFDLKVEKDPSHSIRKQADNTDSSKSAVDRRLRLAKAIEMFPELANEPTERDAIKTLGRIEEGILVETITADAQVRALKGQKIADSNYKIGDVFEGLKSLKAAHYSFAEVDPPYGIEADGRKARYGSGQEKKTAHYHEVSQEKYPAFITRLARDVHRVLAERSWAIFWFGPSWYTEVQQALYDAGFDLLDLPAIWYKGQQGQTGSPDTSLGSCYEMFFVARKGVPRLLSPGRANVFDFKPAPPSQKTHPTEKPLELLVEILETFTLPGARIVVPFLGSGVTLRACYKTKRIGFGWDLSETYKKSFLARCAEDELAEQATEKKE